MNYRSRLSRTLAVWMIAGLSGCLGSSDSKTTRDETGNAGDEIIGGVPANAKVFDAVGYFGTVDGIGCTGTLISPTSVLTARHCVVNFNVDNLSQLELDLKPVYFSIGTDASKPKRRVQVASIATPPKKPWTAHGTEYGGIEFGLGSDVALATLVEPITDVTPFKVADGPVSQSDVNKKVQIVGFGLRDANGSNGLRYTGTMTIGAVTGNPYASVFPTVNDWLAMQETVWGELAAKFQSQEFADRYNRAKIIDGYSIYLVRRDGDAQSCYGDSGGPVLVRDGDSFKVIAVTTGGDPGVDLPCDFGGHYSTFGAEIQEMLKAKDDVCGTMTTAGRCSGDYAIRCSGDGEGKRRVLAVDCSLVGATCNYNADGAASCMDEAPAPAEVRVCGAIDASKAGSAKKIMQGGEPEDLPMGGTILDGAYVLDSMNIFTGEGGKAHEVESIPAEVLEFKGDSFTSYMKGRAWGGGTSTWILANETFSANIEKRRAGELVLRSTCPVTGSWDSLHYTATADSITVFKFDYKGSDPELPNQPATAVLEFKRVK